MQIVLMNQALKLVEWVGDKEQKELNPGQFVLRRNETTRVSNQRETYYAGLAPKWLRHVEMKKMLLIGLYKWKTAITTRMHSVECTVRLPLPRWSSERAETAGGVLDTGWGLGRCGLLPYLGDLLMRTILQWTMNLIIMNCLMKRYCIMTVIALGILSS